MTVTVFIVVLVMVGKFVFTTNSFSLQVGFLYFVYFLPIVASGLAYVYARYNQSADGALDNEASKPSSLENTTN